MRPQGRCAWTRTACAVTVAVAAALIVTPDPVLAQTSRSGNASPTPSLVATGAAGYDLDFTLPTAAKAGCMVCHGDQDLVRLKDGVLKSYYLEPAVMDASAHASVQCTGCHMNFAFTLPHVTAGTDWRTTAKSACKNCHEDQFYRYGQGVHRQQLDTTATVDPDQPQRPLCGDCHGSHAIPILADNPEGQAEMQHTAWETCGRCHTDYWDAWNDYYHGAAYKDGAHDAPACWDCHGAHDIFPSDDPQSSVGSRHLGQTCATCHEDAVGRYLQYADFVHGREGVNESVPLRGWLEQVRDILRAIFGG